MDRLEVVEVEPWTDLEVRDFPHPHPFVDGARTDGQPLGQFLLFYQGGGISAFTRTAQHARIVFRPEEGVFEHPHHPPMDTWFFAFASAGHIEAFDSVLSDKFL